MTTHIILLNGGPRKRGNTFQVAQWVAEGARKQQADVEVIHLVDYHVAHCRGCEACARTGTCVIADDHAAICRKLDQAQGLIVCSPVYGGSCSSILKTFTDRLACTIGFTGRFAHLCSLGITTARYDFRAKTAKDIAKEINTSWSNPGYVTGYIHKQVMDTKKSRNITLSQENSPALYETAQQMGAKLVDDIQQGKRGSLPFPVRMAFKYFVLPGIARILINEREKLQFLYDTLRGQGVITAEMIAKHEEKMARLPDRPWRTGEKIKSYR
jgi:multimeric flavodoxin WrbA